MPLSPALQTAVGAYPPPPHGAPYSVPIPSSEQKGRSAVYRHWRFRDGLLRTLDPEVGAGTLHLDSDTYAKQ